MKNKEYNIFYLIGAGASVDNFSLRKTKKDTNNTSIGLPLANNFYECIEENIIKHLYSKEGSDIIKNRVLSKIYELPQKISNDKESLLPYHSLTHLQISSDDYDTIDEAIRTYYFNNLHDEVFEFKIAISILFYTLENVFYLRDYRYKQLFLSTLSNDRKLPDNMFFITWNYDNQIQHSLNDLLTNNSKGILTAKNFLRINGNADFYSLPPQNVNSISSFRHRHLTTNYHDFHKKNIEKIYKSEKSNIKFAWESDSNQEIKNSLDIMLNNSNAKKNIIVCIGYSFPFINELYDKEIINTLKPDKIYFQNTNNDIDFINHIKDMVTNNYLDNSKQVDFEFIKNVSRFYIPNELTKYESMGNYDIR